MMTHIILFFILRDNDNPHFMYENGDKFAYFLLKIITVR